jgi:predicted ester cyclase
MSPEESIALIRRFSDEFINAHDPEAADVLCTPDFTIHMSGQPPIVGVVAFKQLVAAYFAAFPDFHETTEDVFAAGDRVARRVRFMGTHAGELLGIPPTGTRVSVTSISIFRIADGKVAEEWAENDIFGMLQQLGVIPAPGQPTR